MWRVAALSRLPACAARRDSPTGVDPVGLRLSQQMQFEVALDELLELLDTLEGEL